MARRFFVAETVLEMSRRWEDEPEEGVGRVVVWDEGVVVVLVVVPPPPTVGHVGIT